MARTYVHAQAHDAHAHVHGHNKPLGLLGHARPHARLAGLAATLLLLLALAAVCRGEPAQPTGVRIDERGDGRIRVAWQYPGDVSGVIFMVTSSGGQFATVPGAKADATCGAGGGAAEYSVDVAGLSNGQEYTFTVVRHASCWLAVPPRTHLAHAVLHQLTVVLSRLAFAYH